MTVLLAVFTDASFCHETLAAGWGGWAKRDGWTHGVTRGGTFRKGAANSSSEAEIYAPAMFLRCLGQEGLLEGVGAVMLQADCMRVIQACLRNVPGARLSAHADSAEVMEGGSALSPSEAEAVAFISHALAGRSLLLRHVRGHSSGGGRQKVNDIVDSIAKRHMRGARGSLGIRSVSGCRRQP